MVDGGLTTTVTLTAEGDKQEENYDWRSEQNNRLTEILRIPIFTTLTVRFPSWKALPEGIAVLDFPSMQRRRNTTPCADSDAHLRRPQKKAKAADRNDKRHEMKAVFSLSKFIPCLILIVMFLWFTNWILLSVVLVVSGCDEKWAVSPLQQNQAVENWKTKFSTFIWTSTFCSCDKITF